MLTYNSPKLHSRCHPTYPPMTVTYPYGFSSCAFHSLNYTTLLTSSTRSPSSLQATASNATSTSISRAVSIPAPPPLPYPLPRDGSPRAHSALDLPVFGHTVVCSIQYSDPLVYQLALWTYAIGAAHFASEWLVLGRRSGEGSWCGGCGG
jgi:hypothetical protein